MIRISIIVLILQVTFTFSIYAQKKKFGKVSKEELEMKVYSKDSSANAVVLFDVGRSYFNLNSEGYFELIHERHRRVKIFNKQGYNYANIEIPFYDAGNSRKENVYGIKAYTHNLENGKVIKTKLGKNNIFEETLSQFWKQSKFTMPDVKEGCIIEYEYKITSDFIGNLREWNFQDIIPINWSEYLVEIPEYYSYKKFIQGYEPFHIKKNDTYKKTFTVKYSAEITSGVNGGRTSGGNYNIEPYVTANRWVAKDVRAFKGEKFITTYADYLSKIEFQLESIQMPNQLKKNVSNSWVEIADRLRKDEDFGVYLNKKGAVKDIVASIIVQSSTDLEKLRNAYEYISNNFKSFDIQSIYTDQTIRQLLFKKEGRNSEINLLLTLILKELGIKAYPILVSTRRHGNVNTLYTSSRQFNYVLVYAEVDGKGLLLDASSKDLNPGELPYKTLNGQGLAITDTDYSWVNIVSTMKNSHFYTVMLKVNEEGKLAGQVQIKEGGYNALARRYQISDKGKDEYIKKNWDSDITGLELKEYKIDNLEDISKPLIINYEVISEESSDEDILYLNAFIEKVFEENPFKLEERKYPVDFAYNFQERYFFSLVLPEGYVVDEMPKSLSIITPDKSIVYSQATGQMGNTISIRVSFSINKPIFQAQEYQTLKETINQIIEKQSEQIVLKKKN